MIYMTLDRCLVTTRQNGHYPGMELTIGLQGLVYERPFLKAKEPCVGGFNIQVSYTCCYASRVPSICIPRAQVRRPRPQTLIATKDFIREKKPEWDVINIMPSFAASILPSKS